MSSPPKTPDTGDTRRSEGPPAGLAHRLRTAGGRELERLVDEEGRWIGLAEMRQALLNPHATTAAVEALASNRKLLAEPGVKAALARHRKTPPTVAMRFVPSLFWRELLEISVDLRIHAGVRRSAENYLVQRLPRLAVGERVALARRAPERIALELGRSARLDAGARVLDALLSNARLTEEVVLDLAGARDASPRALQRLADDERWGPRYEVSLALCRNPRTPSREVLARLPRLQRDDLETVADLEEHGWVVRHRARQILDEWPADRYRGRVRSIESAEDSRFILDTIDSSARSPDS